MDCERELDEVYKELPALIEVNFETFWVLRRVLMMIRTFLDFKMGLRKYESRRSYCLASMNNASQIDGEGSRCWIDIWNSKS